MKSRLRTECATCKWLKIIHEKSRCANPISERYEGIVETKRFDRCDKYAMSDEMKESINKSIAKGWRV